MSVAGCAGRRPWLGGGVVPGSRVVIPRTIRFADSRRSFDASIVSIVSISVSLSSKSRDSMSLEAREQTGATTDAPTSTKARGSSRRGRRVLNRAAIRVTPRDISKPTFLWTAPANACQ